MPPAWHPMVRRHPVTGRKSLYLASHAGRIFGMSHRGEDEVVWALSETDGKALWATRLGPAFRQEGWPQGNEGPGSTPTVDGERLYVEGLGGTVSCVQVRDGKLVWQRSLTQDFGGRVPTWSFRESPLVDGDKVIVTPGGEDATLVALDKLTGKTIWKSQMPAGSVRRGLHQGDQPLPGAEFPAVVAVGLDVGQPPAARVGQADLQVGGGHARRDRVHAHPHRRRGTDGCRLPGRIHRGCCLAQRHLVFISPTARDPDVNAAVELGRRLDVGGPCRGGRDPS